MFGFLNINKPPGPTSHDIVARIRRIIPPRIKVGHTGTLDPFAEGVLVVCVGPATRLADYVRGYPKRYIADVTLGATSTTDDPEGEITERSPLDAPPLRSELENVLQRFVGRIRQVPPVHSAVHVDGRRAYQLARAGERVNLPPREVTIHRIDMLSYDYPNLQIDVRCEGGTYIRALGRDIAAQLGVGGYCSKLIRTEVGPFRLQGSVSIDELDPQRDLLDALSALKDLPHIAAGTDQIERVRNGNWVELSEVIVTGEVAVVDERGRLLAIARIDEHRRLIPQKVFPAQPDESNPLRDVSTEEG